MSDESYYYILIQVFISRSSTKHSKSFEKKHWITPHLLARRYFYFTNLRSRCIFTRADLVVGRTREPRPPFLLKILYYFYRIRRKIKADEWASVPATPFWIFWLRPWFRLTKKGCSKGANFKRLSWRLGVTYTVIKFAPLAYFHTTSCKSVETLRRKSDLP